MTVGGRPDHARKNDAEDGRRKERAALHEHRQGGPGAEMAADAAHLATTTER